MYQMIELGRTTEVTALVIDVKDDRGFLCTGRACLWRGRSAPHNSPMSRPKLRALLDSMRKHNIYPLAASWS